MEEEKKEGSLKKFKEDSSDISWMKKGGLICANFGSSAKNKIVGFDLDGTIIVTKSGAIFPRNAADWKFFHDCVPEVLRKYEKDGYRIVIFTN